jgi:hypothetical protein
VAADWAVIPWGVARGLPQWLKKKKKKKKKKGKGFGLWGWSMVKEKKKLEGLALRVVGHIYIYI